MGSIQGWCMSQAITSSLAGSIMDCPEVIKRAAQIGLLDAQGACQCRSPEVSSERVAGSTPLDGTLDVAFDLTPPSWRTGGSPIAIETNQQRGRAVDIGLTLSVEARGCSPSRRTNCIARSTSTAFNHHSSSLRPAALCSRSRLRCPSSRWRRPLL